MGQPELRGPLAFLRRPFSIADRHDDAQGTCLDVIHRVVGVGTAWLATLGVGDPVDLIGPLGNSFTLPATGSIGLLAGGGVGLPPMFYLARILHEARWKAVGFVGAQTGDLLAVTPTNRTHDPEGRPVGGVQEFACYGFESVVTTDDGSAGLRGRITDGLKRFLDSQPAGDHAKTVVYTCGPEPMMHAVALLAASHEVACQVCLEQAMACGMGTCQSCVVRIDQPNQDPHGTTPNGRPWRYRLACTDGPVFPADTVVWSG